MNGQKLGYKVAGRDQGYAPMKPAYPIVLTSQDHALLGEVVEIMGQTDDIIVGTVARLLNIDRPAANKIMGSTRIADNVRVWAREIRNRSQTSDVSKLVGIAKKRIKELAEYRNDFIHALFTNDYADNYVEPGYQTTTATRRKSGKSRPVSDLQ